MAVKKVRTIMLIEDVEIDSFIHEQLFKASGHDFKLLVHTNVASALNYFKALTTFDYRESPLVPEYIFLDLIMPVQDGFDFLAAFNALPNAFNSKIVILTVSMLPEDRLRAQKIKKVDHYFAKPLLLEYLKTLKWD